jgi:hypothetical protein
MYIYLYYVKGGVILGRKKAAFDFIERVDAEEEVEDGFSEDVQITGTVLTSFSFIQEPEPLPIESKVEIPEKLIDNRKFQTQAYGITPPVDGEFFEVKRTFMFRRSTVRMLNKLKAEHENENVYLSSIVDEVIRFYYGQKA